MASPPEYEARSAESFLQAATRKSLGDSLPAPTQTSDAKAAGPRSQSVMTQDFEANSAASLFGFELWDCGTKVFAQANRGIRFHRRIGKLLQTISDAHLECAKKVAKAVERADTCMPNYSHPSMSTSIEGFQGMMRAMTAMTLAQNTFAVHSASSSRHIFDSFSNMEAEIKQLERQHAHLEREMKSVIAAHSESRKKFYDAVSKHKELKESHNWPSDSKVAAKLAEREKEVKRREAELKAVAETLNETRDITNGHSFPSLLKAVYCVEEMRIQTMRQAINQFGCLVRNQKIPFKQIGEQILAASHSVKALEDLKQYQEAVATNLPVPSDEPIEIYDVQTCKVTSFEMDESERAVASLHFLNSSPTSRDDVSPKRDTAREDPGLLKGLKSMFSGLRKKSEGADRAAAGAATGGSALAQRRLSKITVKRFYGLNIDNHLTRKFRGYPVPLIAAVLMEFVLSMEGSKTQGIFRLSAPAGEMAAARNQIEVCFVYVALLLQFLFSLLVSDTSVSD
jgi:hypothetical protein